MVKNVHFIGIGGIGVSALARYYLLNGFNVSGCDIKDSEIISDLRKLGAEFYLGHSESHIKSGSGKVIYTDALPKNNEELHKAQNLNLDCKSYPEALGELASLYESVAVAGTNGKSTTAAMLGLILERADMDPTVVVGSRVSSWGGNFRSGNSKVMVLEACEYRKNFLNIHPNHIVLTNIEAEHLDAFSGIDEIKQAFLEFILESGDGGFVIYNFDDSVSREISGKIKKKLISYGQDKKSDLVLGSRAVSGHTQKCVFIYKDEAEIDADLKVPGVFNAYNAMAASSAALALGVSPQVISGALNDFSGIWRRFEYLGQWRGAKIYSDYAHHPTSIAGIIKACREFFGDKRIIFVFEPHQRARTYFLRREFVKALSLADNLVLLEIYDVAGREEQGIDISSAGLFDEISGPVLKKYASHYGEAKKILEEEIKKDDIIIMMGAGGIDEFARSLTKNES